MKSMRYYFAIPIFIFVFLLETTVCWKLTIFGYSPNLLLCLTVVFSFLYEERFGLFLGVIFGGLLDIATSPYFGPQAISFFLVYIAVRLLRGIFNHEKLVPDVLMVLLATPVNLIVVWVLNRICGVPTHFGFVLKAFIPVLIMQAAATAIFHLIFVHSVIKHKQDRRYTGGLA